jgi:acyl carrier protein
MNYEEVKEIILDILQELHEDIDYEKEDKLVDNKLLDSFDLISLVTDLGDEFDVEITAKDFIAENFNSLDSLTNMIIKLVDE